MATMVIWSGVESGHLFPVNGDAAFLLDSAGHQAGEFHPVDGQGVPGGHRARIRAGQQGGPGPAHFLLEQPGRAVFALRLERIGADQLGKVGRLMRGRGAQRAVHHRAHFVEVDLAAAAGCHQGSLGAGQAAADDTYPGWSLPAQWAGSVSAARLARAPNAAVVDPHDAPLVEKLRAQPLVKVDGGLVPGQNVPLQPDAALLRGARGHPRQQRFADTLPAEPGQHEQIFQVDAGAAPPGGVVVEVEGKAGRFAVRGFGDQALEAGVLAEAVAQQVGLGGLNCVGLPLISGESADQIQNQRNVGGSSSADRVHRQNFSLQLGHKTSLPW